MAMDNVQTLGKADSVRPRYMQIADRIEQKLLDPAEKRRDDLVELIGKALDSLPKPSSHDAYLGDPLSQEPDLSAWEHLPQEGGDRIKVLAGGLSALHGQPRWHAPSVMHNVNPPPLLDTIAATTVASLYNPNLLWDFVSAGVHTLERQIFRQMGRLAGWKESQPDGVFTFGGKGCLTYAVRIGLNRCTPGISSHGLPTGKKPVVVTSAANHYTIDTVCSLVGLGTEGCVRIPTKADDTIDILAYAETLDRLMADKTPIACIIASGGNTLDMSVDSPAEMRRIADDLGQKHGLTYKPFLYFDTVVGWPWLSFKDYDWSKNHLEISPALQPKLKTLGDRLAEVSVCDGFSCDYHKTGLAPYSSSSFVIRNAAELHSIFKDTVTELPRDSHGNNFVQHHTIEHSRSAGPSISAWIALQNVGVDGLRSYLARMTEIGTAFQTQLPQYGIEHINPHGLGFAGVFWPRAKNGPSDYAELLKATPEVLEASNKYTFALFDQLANPDDGSKPIMLRYLPQYRQSQSGLPAATIVIYPMALATTNADITELVEQIGKTATRLAEPNVPFRAFRFNPPKHVPK